MKVRRSPLLRKNLLQIKRMKARSLRRIFMTSTGTGEAIMAQAGMVVETTIKEAPDVIVLHLQHLYFSSSHLPMFS